MVCNDINYYPHHYICVFFLVLTQPYLENSETISSESFFFGTSDLIHLLMIASHTAFPSHPPIPPQKKTNVTPETNSSPLNLGLFPKKNNIVFQPSIFMLLVSGRVSLEDEFRLVSGWRTMVSFRPLGLVDF